MSIHLGHFQVTTTRMPLLRPFPGGPKTVEVIKTEEKGSDVNLATYLLVDAFREDCDVAVVMSNDSDLAEPIRIVRHELTLPVGIVNPSRPAKRSRGLEAIQPTFFKQIRVNALRQCQFPEVMRDEHGEIRRPAKW